MIKITKPFSVSENGIEITKYEENSLHEDLPPVALAHGKSIDAYTKEKSPGEIEAEKVKAAEAKKIAEAKAKKIVKAKTAEAEKGTDQ